MAKSVRNIMSDILKSIHGVSEAEANPNSQLGLASYEFIVLSERLEQHSGMTITDNELISLETFSNVDKLLSTCSKKQCIFLKRLGDFGRRIV